MQKPLKLTTLSPEQQSELESRLVDAAEDGRIPCAKAFAIAKSLKISAAEVGLLANKLQFKISKCQLGCF